jgi:hypothetical protein
VKDDSSDHIKRAFPVVRCSDFMVVTPSFTHLIITFSDQRFSNCSPTVDVGFVKLMSESFCGNGPQYEHSVLLQFTYAAISL